MAKNRGIREEEKLDSTQKSKTSRKKKAPRDRQNREFAVVAYSFLALFIGLMGYFVYFQVYESEDFINNSHNTTQELLAEDVIRGDIVAADGEILAHTTVDALGNETVTSLQGFVPIDIDPRALTPHFEGLEGLKAGEDVRAKIAASLEGKLETDACTAQLEFVHDANGAPGTAMAEGETFAAGTYWVRVNGLLGNAAQNYTLASDGAASFTVAASGSAGGTGSGTDGGTGSNAGSADKNGKGNKGKNSGGKLADTGDGSGIAAGLAAAAVATTVAGAAMLASDRENTEDVNE